jgi:hypothetical protein
MTAGTVKLFQFEYERGGYGYFLSDAAGATLVIHLPRSPDLQLQDGDRVSLDLVFEPYRRVHVLADRARMMR